jgi:opacity protein-like surface antigen
MKNNFKMTLVLITISLLSNNLFAQRPYVSLNAGYGFKMSAQNLSIFNFYNSTITDMTTSYEQVNVSLGKGLNSGGTIGYMFNKHIGAELGISYLIGSKAKFTEKDVDITTNYSISSKMLRIIPSVVISSGFDKINPYARFGLVIGKGSVMIEAQNDLIAMKMKMNGGIAFGISSGIGANYNLNQKISIFGELNMVNMSYAPTKGKIMEANILGIDMVGDMTTNERETDYVDSYTVDNDPNNPPSDSEPSKLPFGSLGLNFGLRFNL